ncbi:hypothetical protein MRX96_029014 [Rhipicephalus microplus]
MFPLSLRRGHLASMGKSDPHQENVAHCEEPSSGNVDYGQFLLHLRQLQVPVTYTGKTINVPLVVLACSGPNLCGRDIIQAFQLTGGPVLNVDINDGKLPKTDLFAPGLGLIKGYPVHLQETGPATTGVPEQPEMRTENNEPLDKPLRRSTRCRMAPDRF